MPDYWYLAIPLVGFVGGILWALFGTKTKQNTRPGDCSCPKGVWGNGTGWNYSCPRHGKRGTS